MTARPAAAEQPCLPPDEAQRRRALDAGRSFIVQAPAGSGKTELLVRRYLTLLAKVEAPEQILAITFTRKATAEMRLRVINALNRAREDALPQDNREIRALAEAVLANDEKHGWRITANTRRLRIQTIDAFCNELVRRMPWSARFGSPPDIIANPGQFYRHAAKLTLDHIERDSEWSGACQHLLWLAGADWNKAQTLLADMLEKRDKWMRLLGPASREPLREHLEEMWRQVIDMELRRVEAVIPPPQQTELVELGAFAAGNLIDSGKESDVTALHRAQVFPEASHPHLAQWRGIATLVLTQADSLRKSVNVNLGFPADHKPEKARMLELLQRLAEQAGLVEALGKVRLLPGGEFSGEQWESINALLQLLPLAAAELRLLFKERNQADYIELTQRAEMALGDPDNPSDLALVFDYQITHLLMDEFQDTSTAHIELLTRLTAGWQDGDGRTVFLVGDPMQSIYRFREAEVANFLAVRKDGLGGLPIEPLTLESNFRSAPQLVEWFNDTFGEVLPEHDDIVNSAVKYTGASSRTTDSQAGRFHFHPGINRSPAREAESIATLIGQAQAHNPDESIAVLGRTRGHLSEIAATLRRQAIPFHAVDLEKLTDRPAIRDLIAITRALAQPADRIAWLSLLRAPWCGLSLADLSALAGTDHAATLTELWRDDELVSRLSDHGKTGLRRLADSLTAAFHRRGRTGLRQNVEAAWLSLGGPATLAQPDLDDCHRYLDLLGEMESDGIEITADSLKEATDELWARAGVEARVQLLTIHKAKGLEFDSVFLPALERQPRASEKTLLRWRKLPQQLLIAPLPSSTDSDNPFYKYLEYLEKTQARNEAGRLLYVACTRARNNLHLFGNVKAKDEKAEDGKAEDEKIGTPPSASLLSLLWPLLESHYTEAAAAGDAANASARETTEFQPRPVQRLPPEWRPPALPASIPVAADTDGATDEIEFSWAGETARVIGIVIHQILQQVDETGWEHWRSRAVDKNQMALWRNKLVENGIFGDALETALNQVAAAIDNARNDPKAAWIFSGEHRNIKTEWPLTGWLDGKIAHIVIDRSFTDQNGVRWIIDFKSSHHEGADPDVFLDREQQRHQQQMSQYATVAGQLQPGEIRLGLYFPSLRGWREWSG